MGPRFDREDETVWDAAATPVGGIVLITGLHGSSAGLEGVLQK